VSASDNSSSRTAETSRETARRISAFESDIVCWIVLGETFIVQGLRCLQFLVKRVSARISTHKRVSVCISTHK
jgi:hypothetical protein